MAENKTLKEKERIIWSHVWETLDLKTKKNSNTEDDKVFLSKDVKEAIIKERLLIKDLFEDKISWFDFIDKRIEIFGKWKE